MKIRRSGAYGVAGIVVLPGTQFLPMSTPYWYAVLVYSFACALAGVALYFNGQERRTGQAKRSIAFFTLAVLVLLSALLSVLPLLL